MLSLLRCPGARAFRPWNPSRGFAHTPPILEKPLPPRIKFNEADLTVSYLKGSGPGGQKINKTNSAVQLTHNPTGTVVKCQATRSKSQNQRIAMQLMADRVEHGIKGDQSRVAIKAERAKRKKASGLKKRRRKYRLGDKGEAEAEGEEGEGEDGRGEGDGEGEMNEKDRGQG